MLDGCPDYIKPKKIVPYAAPILASMLESIPDFLTMLRTGCEPDSVREHIVMMILEKSTFGLFFKRRFSRYEQYLKDDGQSNPTTESILRLMMRKWLKTSKDKRSAYRWETFDDDVKEELKHMAPVNKADIQPGANDKLQRSIAKEPACAYCDKKEGCGVELASCPCRVVKYCRGSECQKLDWANHKQLCSRPRSGQHNPGSKNVIS